MKSAAHRWLILIGIGLITLIIVLAHMLLPRPAAAHDRERPDLDDWYHGLHSDAGAWCCEGKEAIHLADIDWESKDGHYRVRVDGQWWDVPEGAVISAPNRDGRPLVWMNGGYQGLKGVRCFMPGSGA